MPIDRLSPYDHVLSFTILGQHVRVECADAAMRAICSANFDGMAAAAGEVRPPDLDYCIEVTDALASMSLIRKGQAPLDATNLCDLLFLLEKDITVELQKQRADLFFLHSAAIDWQGRACLLAAEAGSGKSTTTWALLHHEFRYLSDELSPIDLNSMQVLAYPHALCLKQPPPPPYALPADAIHLGRTIHVPVGTMPSAAIAQSRPIGAVFLLRHDPLLDAPKLRALSAAEASARLYVTALNALAHPNHGLDAVVRIAQHAPCFAPASADLPATCALIRATLEKVHHFP